MRAFALAAVLALACGHPPAVSPSPPSVSITAPADGAQVRAGAAVTFTGAASDAKDGQLGNASLQWSSSLQGELGQGVRVVSSLSAGTHHISLKATNSAGLTATAQITVTATPAQNQPPAPVIDAPADGSSVDQGQPLLLKGHAGDPEDGALPGSSLAWTSSIDGPLGTGAQVSVPAPSIGTHRILLTATDRQGLSAYASISVTVVAAGANHAPAAAISSPHDGDTFTQGATVTFLGTATDAEDGALGGTSLAWTSSIDGAIGSGPGFSKSTLSRGAHVIMLTATDSQGATGSAHIAISISAPGNHPPVAAISEPADGTAIFAGDSVTFSGSATDAEDGALTGASLVWSSSRDGALGTGASISVSTLSAGAHTITLTATDSQGDQGAAHIGLTVLAPNQPPVALITSPSDGAQFNAGDTVQLRGSATDPEDGALGDAALAWTSSLDGLLGHGASLDVASLRAGAHVLTLTATDSGGRTGSASVSVTVAPTQVNLPPVARLGAPAQGLIAQALTFDGSASSDPDGSIAGWKFSFGDGTPDATGSATAQHAYAASGSYTVSLTVTDDKGATGSASAAVEILGPQRIPGVIDDGPNLGAACSVGASAGAIFIAYRDMLHPGLRVATVSNQGTTIEHVDGMGFEVGGAVDYQLSLAVSPDGAPHVAYTWEDGSLRYATKSGGGWLRERADTSAPRANDHYGFIAIAYDSARARPVILYRTQNGNGYPLVNAATRDAGAWTDTTLAANVSAVYGAYFFGGLAIDAAGNASFTYYDYSNGGARIGAWGGSGTAVTSIGLAGAQPAYQMPVPLGLDASDSPVAMYDRQLAPSYSAFEESAVTNGSLALNGNTAWIAYSHGGALEVAHATESGYWQRAALGDMDDARTGIALDASGAARACFFRSGKLMLY